MYTAGCDDDLPDRVDVVRLAVPDRDIGHDWVESKVSGRGMSPRERNNTSSLSDLMRMKHGRRTSL